MKASHHKRVWIWSFAAALACLFVAAYNRLGIWRMESHHATLMGVMIYYLRAQWIGLAVPLVGVYAGFRLKAAKADDARPMVPDCLAIFAFGWCLICILMWRLQDAFVYPEW